MVKNTYISHIKYRLLVCLLFYNKYLSCLLWEFVFDRSLCGSVVTAYINSNTDNTNQLNKCKNNFRQPDSPLSLLPTVGRIFLKKRGSTSSKPYTFLFHLLAIQWTPPKSKSFSSILEPREEFCCCVGHGIVINRPVTENPVHCLLL